MEKQVSESVSDLDQCMRGWDSEWERESVRLLCVRERVRVSKSAEWFVWGEWGVIFENTLFEIEYQTLGFILSKPSLWGSRSTWPNSTWRVHVETPHEIWPYQDAETEPQRLDLEAQNRAFEAQVAKNVYTL